MEEIFFKKSMLQQLKSKNIKSSTQTQTKVQEQSFIVQSGHQTVILT